VIVRERRGCQRPCAGACAAGRVRRSGAHGQSHSFLVYRRATTT